MALWTYYPILLLFLRVSATFLIPYRGQSLKYQNSSELIKKETKTKSKNLKTCYTTKNTENTEKGKSFCIVKN